MFYDVCQCFVLCLWEEVLRCSFDRTDSLFYCIFVLGIVWQKVQTVLGDKTSDDLGFTLVHEHLTAGFPGYEWDNTSFDPEKELASAVVNLKEIQSLSVSSFVVPCQMELGRGPEFVAECADKSGSNVIIVTGLSNEALGILPHFRSLSADDIAQVFVREITEGIGNTGIKAGFIKPATGGIPDLPETAISIGVH